MTEQIGRKLLQIQSVQEDRFKTTIDTLVVEEVPDPVPGAGELLVRVQIPGMAGLFAGRIKQGIEDRLGGLLGSQDV